MLHDIIRDAIISKRSVTAHAEGHVRHFSPHVLGQERDGTEIVIGYQYAGDRPGGLPVGGDWCCFKLATLADARPNDDTWHRGTGRMPRDQLVTLEVWNQ